jgi:hypothetical protein
MKGKGMRNDIAETQLHRTNNVERVREVEDVPEMLVDVTRTGRIWYGEDDGAGVVRRNARGGSVCQGHNLLGKMRLGEDVAWSDDR